MGFGDWVLVFQTVRHHGYDFGVQPALPVWLQPANAEGLGLMVLPKAQQREKAEKTLSSVTYLQTLGSLK